MNIGEKIKELRKSKGLSQTALADVVGVDQRTISVWELNQIEPNDVMKKKLCDYFGISIGELFGEAPIVVEKVIEQKDQVTQLLDRLINAKIITDPDDIPESVVQIILDAVRAEVRLKQLRK